MGTSVAAVKLPNYEITHLPNSFSVSPCLRGGFLQTATIIRFRVVSQFEFLSAVRRGSCAIKRERTSTESSHRRLNRWPLGGAAAGGRRRTDCHHQARRGGGIVDTHPSDRL